VAVPIIPNSVQRRLSISVQAKPLPLLFPELAPGIGLVLVKELPLPAKQRNKNQNVLLILKIALFLVEEELRE